MLKHSLCAALSLIPTPAVAQFLEHLDPPGQVIQGVRYQRTPEVDEAGAALTECLNSGIAQGPEGDWGFDQAIAIVAACAPQVNAYREDWEQVISNLPLSDDEKFGARLALGDRIGELAGRVGEVHRRERAER